MEPRAVSAEGTGPADRAMDGPMRFLRELRQMRSRAGLEPAELAAKAHYPRDVIVAAEAGPALPDLPVLSAYVRGCGEGVAEWEERWRSITGSPATTADLPARPVGSSSLAAAGARAGSVTPVVDLADPDRVMAAITRTAAATAAASIPFQGRPAAGPGRPAPVGYARADQADEAVATGAAGLAEPGRAPGDVPGTLTEAAPGRATDEAPGALPATAPAMPEPGRLPAAASPAHAAPPAPAGYPAARPGAQLAPRPGVHLAARKAIRVSQAALAATVAAVVLVVRAIRTLLRRRG